MPSAAENVKEIGTLIDLGVKCLEGTTERSDGNRVRSARISTTRTTCLEFSCKRAQSRTCSGYAERSRKSRRSGTTPQDLPQSAPPCISANSSDRPGRHLSIATIRVYFCDDNGDNLRQLEVVFCGRNKQRINFCPRIARMDTKTMRYGNGDRVGRTNLH